MSSLTMYMNDKFNSTYDNLSREDAVQFISTAFKMLDVDDNNSRLNFADFINGKTNGVVLTDGFVVLRYEFVE